MSEPNIDSLLKLTAPRQDWKTAAAPSDRQLLPAFSDQLWQLTAPPAPERVAQPRYAADPPSRDNVSEPWSPPRTSVDKHASSEDQSHRDTTSTSSSAPADETQASASSSPPPIDEQQDREVDGDLEQEDQAEHCEAADESGAAEVAGGLPKTPAASDVPTKQASGEAEEMAVQQVAENAAILGKAATNATKTNTAIDSSLTPAIEVAATDAAAETHVASKVVEHPSSLQSKAGLSVDVALATADVQAVDADAPAIAAAAIEIGEGDGKEAAVRQRAATKARVQKKSDAAPSALGSEKQAHPESSSVEAPSAIHPATATAEIKEHRDVGDSTADERPRAHGKESSTRTAQRGESTPMIANASGSAAPNDSANNSGAAAASNDDAGVKSVRAPTVRTDGLPTALARGQRGGRAAQSPELAESATLNRVDTARFVGRVTRAFHFAQERGGTLQLRLSPPELGSLRLELTVKDGALTASLETETPAARRLLLDHLPALRDRLAEQNVRVERFDVDVRRDGQGGHGGQADASPQQQAQQERRDQQSTPTRQRVQKAAVSNAPATERAQPLPANSTGINLVI